MYPEGFEVIEEISGGLCSSILRAVRKSDNVRVVLKCYDASNTKSEMFVKITSEGNQPYIKEAYFLKKVEKVDGCVKMLDYIFDKSSNQYVIVLEDLLSLGYTKLNMEVTNIDGFLNDVSVAWILRDLICTLQQVHALNLLHCDIKPDNIFINRKEKRTKLLDFNIATEILPRDLPISQGRHAPCTPDYAPPEILIQYQPWTPEGEVWSLGVTAFVLLCKKFPFDDPFNSHRTTPAFPEECICDRDLRERTFHARERLGGSTPPIIRLSLPAKEFLICCLRRKPHCRPTLQQLASHPFLKSVTPLRISLSTNELDFGSRLRIQTKVS